MFCGSNIHTSSQTDGKNSERGASLTEFAILLPFMTLLLVLVFDFSMFLQNYFAANHILREGLRIAAQTPNLRATVDPVDDTEANTDVTLATHQVIHNRLDALLALETNAPGVVVKETQCFNNIGGVHSDTEDLVIVTIRGTYSSFLAPVFPAFGTLNYTVTGRAPYLYNGCSA
jgi:hypothetical protein